MKVALDQNGAESAETHDFRSCLDRAGRRPSNPGDVVVHVRGFQTVGRNEGVDVEAARLCSDDPRAGKLCAGNLRIEDRGIEDRGIEDRGIEDRADLDMADRSGRNPWKDVLDFVVRQRRMLRPAQDSEYVRSRPPTLLMPDQSEIDLHSLRPW